jgi:hypothetical protein
MSKYLVLREGAELSLTSAFGLLAEVASGFIQRGEGEKSEPFTQLHLLGLLRFLFYKTGQTARVSLGNAPI